MEIETIKTLIALCAILIFTISEALADANQLLDLRKLSRGRIFESIYADVLSYVQKWHFWQAVRQGTFIVFAAIFAGHWAVALFTASLFWLIHDGIVNIVGLDRKFFFVGTTAWIDRMFQKFPSPSLAMAVAKCLILALSILAFIIS